jgi:hypothetical protein
MLFYSFLNHLSTSDPIRVFNIEAQKEKEADLSNPYINVISSQDFYKAYLIALFVLI